MSAAVVASSSQRSFSAWPAWPFTQTNFTVWGSLAASSRFHRSTFFTGCFWEFFHPRFSQPATQFWLKAFTRYCESEYTVTVQGRFKASRPTMQPSSSMRLLVVQEKPAENSFSCTAPEGAV